MKVLKFGAVWCPGCLTMKPMWKEIEEENSWLQTEYYDIDENPEVAKEHGVDESIPVFIFLDKNKNEFLRLSGIVPKEKLVEIINKNKEK